MRIEICVRLKQLKVKPLNFFLFGLNSYQQHFTHFDFMSGVPRKTSSPKGNDAHLRAIINL